MKNQSTRLTQLPLEILGLSSPRGRLIFFALISLAIFIIPAKWPITFSLWQYLGVDSPSIGMTRAYRLILHGDFVQAWHQNKLIYAVVTIGGMILIKDTLTLIGSYKNSRPS